MNSLKCPLCLSSALGRLEPIESKIYWRCAVCGLTFLSPEHRLNPESERARYEQHQNNREDFRYRKFLIRLSDPLVPRLKPGAEGLDYGSGPGPTLSVMLEEQGYKMKIYDPYFAPETDVLKRTYDFITCTETVEHFYYPSEQFQQLDRLLRRGGYLGILTGMLKSDEQFPGWYYHRDPTHVCFMNKMTMDWIATRFGWKAEYPSKDITLFFKP